MNDRPHRLLCLGLGYSGRAVAERAMAKGWLVTGTSTTEAGAGRLRKAGIDAHVFDGSTVTQELRDALQEAQNVLVSIPPERNGANAPEAGKADAALRKLGDLLAISPVAWIGYLSTVGVYGDHGGAWVDEDTPAAPASQRSKARLAAETGWQAIGERAGARVQVFRLAGIYGPGRSPFDRLRQGTAQRIIKPGQVFNRIHVDDIADCVLAGLAGRGSSGTYNVTDDLPAAPQDVVAHAAEILGVVPPPEVPFDQAPLSDMARSFYSENKRVRNVRLKSELGIQLCYPTYREGLAAIAAQMDRKSDAI